MKSDTLNWLTIDSATVASIREFAKVPSSIQSHALAVLELRGDTVVENFPQSAFPPLDKLAAPYTETPKIKQATTYVFPNPNAGSFSLVIDAYEGEVSLNLVDISGRSILQSNQSVKKNQNLQLAWDNLANGIYLLNILDSESRILGHHKISIIH